MTKTLNHILAGLLLVTMAWGGWAKAHEDEKIDSFNLEATLQLYQMAAELSPHILDESLGSDMSAAVIKVRGRRVLLNSHFMELVRRWVRIYHEEILRDCDNCVEFTDEELIGEARDLASRGFFNTKIVGPLAHATEHIALETADIGASLGNVALVSKVASEVAETVLSKTVGGGGVHILCNIIDAIIIFGTRHLQVATRLPTWGPRMGAGSMGMALKYWLVSGAIKRAKKRVSFFTGPIELDPEAIALIDDEGPKQRKWWGMIPQGRRAKWMAYLDKKLGPIYQELKLVQEQLQVSPEDKSLQKRHKTLEEKILNYTKLKQKEFLGNRYKRFLFLKARRGARFLKGDSPLEPALNKDFLWVINVQENILHRGLIPEGDEAISQSYLVQQSLRSESQDQVLMGLAEEAAAELSGEDKEAKIELIRGLLSDVEFVFDKSRPATHRYLQTLVIESTLVNFFYKLVKWQVEAVEPGEGGWWSHIVRASRFRWGAGQFVKYVYEYTDFLRLAAATSSDVFRARYKYEAMETLLRIFDHLEQMGFIFKNHATMKEMLAPVKQSNLQLFSFKPWREKKMVYSWIPGRNPAPMCADMWEEKR